MGVTYKLRDEVVQFIISQRQSNPLASCRQLAESSSQKFGLRLSKSSVHDVLRESGIVTPRGRKPKNKFEIPQEKKKQIQTSLSQVKLPPDPLEVKQGPSIGFNEGEEKQSFKETVADNTESGDGKGPQVHPAGHSQLPAIGPMEIKRNDAVPIGLFEKPEESPARDEMENLPEYQNAGKIFLKAALWDLGIFSDTQNIKPTDWEYYLTYSKGIKVDLENDKNFFIDLSLPLERCIREMADGLVNNVRPLVVQHISDEMIFKACMESQASYRMRSISIVGSNDHILLILHDIMEQRRVFNIENRLFVESEKIDRLERAKALFFPEPIDGNDVIENLLNLNGFDTINQKIYMVNLLIDHNFPYKSILQGAAEKLNGMYIYDEQDRLVSVKIQETQLS